MFKFFKKLLLKYILQKQYNDYVLFINSNEFLPPPLSIT